MGTDGSTVGTAGTNAFRQSPGSTGSLWNKALMKRRGLRCPVACVCKTSGYPQSSDQAGGSRADAQRSGFLCFMPAALGGCAPLRLRTRVPGREKAPLPAAPGPPPVISISPQGQCSRITASRAGRSDTQRTNRLPAARGSTGPHFRCTASPRICQSGELIGALRAGATMGAWRRWLAVAGAPGDRSAFNWSASRWCYRIGAATPRPSSWTLTPVRRPLPGAVGRAEALCH
jgi:hypothetical protein